MYALSPDLIKDIRDPEKPESLEELEVVYEDGVKVEALNEDTCLIRIQFTPTVPHCSLATLIGKTYINYIYMLQDRCIFIRQPGK